MQKVCKRCGAKLQEGGSFCGMCGTKIEEEILSEETEGDEVYLFHPIKIARRLAAKYTIEAQEKRKKFLRFFLVLFEVVLLCGNIAACGDTVYTGGDLIRQTLRVDFSGWNQWGKAVVPLLFLIYGCVLIRTFMVKERAFQKHIKPIWNVNLLLLFTVVFYAATDYFDLKSGSFVCLAISIAVNGLMLYGTAYEIQNGLEPVPEKIHDWFVPQKMILSLAFFEIIFCAAMYMKCSDQDLKMLFWVPVAMKIFSAGVSCWKKEKSYQLMRMQSCVDLICCVVLFLFYKTYNHSTQYLLDSGLMLAMGVVSPFGFNYLWERQGGEPEIKDTYKKAIRLAILLVAIAGAVSFASAARTTHNQRVKAELLEDFDSHAEGIWELEGIHGNLVIYSRLSDTSLFQCGIDGELVSGVISATRGRMLSTEQGFELWIKEKLDTGVYLVDIDYTTYGRDRERREDVKITRIDPEEVSSYIAQSVSDQARTDLGGVYVPMSNEMWSEGEETSIGEIRGNNDLNDILENNDGMIRGRCSLQYTKNGALLYAPPIYASYEVNPAQEFRCVSRYSDTKYDY